MRGSSAEFEEVKALLSYYHPNLRIRQHNCEDVEDIGALIRQFREVIQANDLPDSDVIIDVTGGKKTTSIAAAIFTMDRKETEFQYVSTSGKKEVTGFNVGSQSSGEFEG